MVSISIGGVDGSVSCRTNNGPSCRFSRSTTSLRFRLTFCTSVPSDWRAMNEVRWHAVERGTLQTWTTMLPRVPKTANCDSHLADRHGVKEDYSDSAK